MKTQHIEPWKEQQADKTGCEIKKLYGSDIIKCSFDCAISHDCPISCIDEHGSPIIKLMGVN